MNNDSPRNKNKIEELQRHINFLKNENESLRNNLNSDSSSSTSTSNLRRIGDSGKSTHELEKTIALMKKIIVKLQQENEMLKSNSVME